MLMSWSLLVMWWRRHLGAEDLLTEHHFHDLGKLCFAFTAFWGYLTFGQYLVIWYGNMGEETHWPRLRLIAPWMRLTVAVGVHGVRDPLLRPALARREGVPADVHHLRACRASSACGSCATSRSIPSLHGVPAQVPFGIWEIGVTAGMLGLWLLAYGRFMNAFPRMRVVLMTSPYRDEVQIPVDPETMEPLPAHE